MIIRGINVFDETRENEINAEIIATFVFILISGSYILLDYGAQKMIDILLLWMFPASIMVFLTLVLVKIIERWSKIRAAGHRYLDLRSH